MIRPQMADCEGTPLHLCPLFSGEKVAGTAGSGWLKTSARLPPIRRSATPSTLRIKGPARALRVLPGKVGAVFQIRSTTEQTLRVVPWFNQNRNNPSALRGEGNQAMASVQLNLRLHF